MTIEKVGPLDPVQKYERTDKAARPTAKLGHDSIEVSDEAKIKAELFKVEDEVRVSSDVREDRIADVKRKLEDPNYIDDKVVSSVADSIMDLFKLR